MNSVRAIKAGRSIEHCIVFRLKNRSLDLQGVHSKLFQRFLRLAFNSFMPLLYIRLIMGDQFNSTQDTGLGASIVVIASPAPSRHLNISYFARDVANAGA